MLHPITAAARRPPHPARDLKTMPKYNASSTAMQVTDGLSLSGRTMLVTGANSGLGRETMRVLALRGARVIGASRTLERAAEACEDMSGETVPLACDLSDPSSVRTAVEAVREPVHAIIANAGVMALQERTLMHGIEAHMLINHVGHFMLVTGLLDRLSPDARVVVLSSAAHSYARGKSVTFDGLGWDRPYKPWTAYGHSKLANILFAKGLAARLEDGQTANALHPGIVATPLFRHLPEAEAARMNRGLKFRSVPQGAATQVFVATHPSAASVTGAYFGDCKERQPSKLARDAALAKRLWETTERVVAQL